MRVELTRESAIDLAEIYEYHLSQHGERRAEKVRADLNASLQNLASTYSIHPLFTGVPNWKNIRVKHHRNTYSIFYQTREVGKEILVLRIWHNARNPEELTL
jgi:plasmid stabilization system protein ParE